MMRPCRMKQDAVQLANGDIGISQGGRLASLPDSSAALQFEEGQIYRFLVNGRSVEIDTTPAGLRAATNGDLAGAISDAEAALRTAIDATSGVGTSTVSSASSVTGSTIRLDLTDATGRPIVVSDMQTVSRDAYAAGSLAIRQIFPTRTHGSGRPW